MVKDRDTRKKYDPDCLSGYVSVHKFDEADHKSIAYNCLGKEKPVVVSNRDLFYAREYRWVTLRDGRRAAIVAGGHIDGGERWCPVPEQVVRAIFHFFAWIYIPDEKTNSIQTHYMIHVNAGGLVPPALVNIVNERQVHVVKAFREALKHGHL
jgi:hypothetical protein